MLSRAGFGGAFEAGGPAFGARFCPAPGGGETTGKGGDVLQGGLPGYVCSPGEIDGCLGLVAFVATGRDNWFNEPHKFDFFQLKTGGDPQ